MNKEHVISGEVLIISNSLMLEYGIREEIINAESKIDDRRLNNKQSELAEKEKRQDIKKTKGQKRGFRQ